VGMGPACSPACRAPSQHCSTVTDVGNTQVIALHQRQAACGTTLQETLLGSQLIRAPVQWKTVMEVQHEGALVPGHPRGQQEAESVIETAMSP